MATRRCIHCEADIEIAEEGPFACPACGRDPDLPNVGFDDAPAFFLTGDPMPQPATVPVRITDS